MTGHIAIISRFPLIRLIGLQCGTRKRNHAGKEKFEEFMNLLHVLYKNVFLLST